MKIIFVALMVSAFAAPALAQQQPPDPAMLQRAIAALQAQRNQAMDTAAAESARGAGLADDLAKAKARIEDLEKKPEPTK